MRGHRSQVVMVVITIVVVVVMVLVVIVTVVIGIYSEHITGTSKVELADSFCAIMNTVGRTKTGEDDAKDGDGERGSGFSWEGKIQI